MRFNFLENSLEPPYLDETRKQKLITGGFVENEKIIAEEFNYLFYDISKSLKKLETQLDESKNIKDLNLGKYHWLYEINNESLIKNKINQLDNLKQKIEKPQNELKKPPTDLFEKNYIAMLLERARLIKENEEIKRIIPYRSDITPDIKICNPKIYFEVSSKYIRKFFFEQTIPGLLIYNTYLKGEISASFGGNRFSGWVFFEDNEIKVKGNLKFRKENFEISKNNQIIYVGLFNQEHTVEVRVKLETLGG